MDKINDLNKKIENELKTKEPYKILEDQEIQKMLKNVFENREIVFLTELNTFKTSVINVIRAYLEKNNIEFIDDSKNIYLTDQLTSYFNELKKLPIYTREEEIDAFTRYNNEKDPKEKQKIKDDITIHNLRLAAFAALNTRIDEIELADKIEEANIALLKVIDLYDLSKGCAFSTYAVSSIKFLLKRECQSKSSHINFPAYINERLEPRIRKFEEKYQEKYGTGIIYTNEVIDKLHKEVNEDLEKSKYKYPPISKDIIISYISTKSITSLDTKLDDEDTFGSTVGDLVSDPNANVEDSVIDDSLKNVLIELLDTNLSERDADIFYRRFGLNGYEASTYEEIGQIYGLTRVRIYEIINKCLNKIKKNKKIIAILKESKYYLDNDEDDSKKVLAKS